jgi:hypothetical protein
VDCPALRYSSSRPWLARVGTPLRRPRGEVGRHWERRTVSGLVLQPRGEVGMDQGNIPGDTGTVVGGNPVGSGSSVRSSTVALGRVSRSGPVPLVMASCCRHGQRPMAEPLVHRVVRSLARVSRISLPLLVAVSWPPCPCVSKRGPPVPRRAPLSALPSVGPTPLGVVFLGCSCLP